MQLSDIIYIIEKAAPPAFAAPWDKSGIQVASVRTDIKHLAVSLDPTPLIVRTALDAGADMLLTHHPLTLAPRFPDRLDLHHRVLSLLFTHDMPLYAAHTSLDANPQGPSAWLPDELGLSDRSLLEETGRITLDDGTVLQGGFGCVGTLSTPLSLGELAALVGRFLPQGRVNPEARLAGTVPDRISRVAVCTGSGSSLAGEALALGAEVLITGDLKYHGALDIVSMAQSVRSGGGGDYPAALPFAVLDVGHFALEEEMTRRLAADLARQMPDVNVTFLPGRDPFQPCHLYSRP